MDENVKKIFILNEEYTDKLKQVNLAEIDNNINGPDFFKKSGLELISDYLKKKLGNRSYIFEYSIFSSSIEDNILTDCLLVNTEEGTSIDEKLITERYKILYNILRKQELGIYFQNFFFRAPENYVSYISDKNDLVKSENNDFQKVKELMDDQIERIRDEDKIEFESFGNLKYKNISFLQSKSFNYDIDAFSTRFENVSYLNNLLYSLFLNYFTRKESVKQYSSNKYLISIPILGARSVKEKEITNSSLSNYFEGQGAVFLFVDFGVDLTGISNLLNEVSSELSYIIKDIIINYVLYAGIKLKDKAIQASVKSAIAAIMARNMSHNLGSHVLSRLNSRFSDIEKINRLLKDMIPIVIKKFNLENHTNVPEELKEMDKMTIGEIFRSIDDDEKIDNDKREEIKNFLKQEGYYQYDNYIKSSTDETLLSFGHFFKYLQNRQDYIATITGSGKDVPISQNFKNDILDEMMIAEKRKRHDKKEVKNIIMENILLSEKISGNMIKILFNNWDCSTKEHPGKDIAQSLDIAIPAGNIGTHAFFSIFENFIRNSAKHSSKRIDANKNLEIKIETPDIFWDKDKEQIANKTFAGKVFTVIQRNSDNPIIKGPYYIKEYYQEFKFYAEIPHLIKTFSIKGKTIELNMQEVMREIKDFGEYWNEPKIIIKKNEVHKSRIDPNYKLKIDEQSETFYILSVLDNNNKLRSYPIHIIQDKTDTKAYIFITSKYILKKSEKNNIWDLINDSSFEKYHQSTIYKFSTVNLDEKIEINNDFDLILNKNYYNPNDLIRFTLTDNLGNYNKFHENIEKGLSEPLINNTGQLLESNKGLKEMWISASWIRGEDLDNKKVISPPIMSCVCNNTQSNCFDCHLADEKKHGSLQYVFYFKKTKEILFILSNDINKRKFINSYSEQSLKTFGIEFISYKDFKFTENLHKYFVYVKGNHIVKYFEDNFKKNERDRSILIGIDTLETILLDDGNEKYAENIKSKVLSEWININWRKDKKDKCKDYLFIIDNKIKVDKINDIDYPKIKVLKLGEARDRSIDDKKYNNYIWQAHLESLSAFKHDITQNYFKSSRYIESITGNNKTSWLLRDYIPHNQYWALSLLEAAKCKVLIIDERIWEEKSEIKKVEPEMIENAPNHDNILRKRNELIHLILEKKNIEIYDYNKDFCKDSFYNLLGFKYSINDLDCHNFDIITVHQGIIDKIVNNTGKTVHDIQLLFQKCKAKIITHTGRSRPDPDQIMFGKEGNYISFTSLNSALNDSKYHLVNLLYSVRGGLSE